MATLASQGMVWLHHQGLSVGLEGNKCLTAAGSGSPALRTERAVVKPASTPKMTSVSIVLVCILLDVVSSMMLSDKDADVDHHKIATLVRHEFFVGSRDWGNVILKFLLFFGVFLWVESEYRRYRLSYITKSDFQKSELKMVKFDDIRLL